MLTAVDAARELTSLARCFAAAFASFAGLSTAGPVARRTALVVASRVLGEHAQGVLGLVPESVLLADARAAGAAAPIDLPADPVAALDELDRVVAALAARATPVADGAFLRFAAHVRADLATARRALVVADG